MSPLFIALILGLVEGITEFLPISSTGHLILVGDMLSFKGENAQAFDVVIQLGAILGVVLLYRGRFLDLIPKYGQTPKSALAGLRGCWLIGLGCLPAAVAGALFHKHIKELLFYPAPVAVALVLGGLVMLWLERRDISLSRNVDAITSRDALIIGLAQTLALWPGISRSGATIVAAVLLGFSRVAAAEYSFLLAVPLLTMAAVHDMYKHPALFSGEQLGMLAVGFVFSFLSAVVAVKAFVAFLGRASLSGFAWYRIVLGVLILLVLHAG